MADVVDLKFLNRLDLPLMGTSSPKTAPAFISVLVSLSNPTFGRIWRRALSTFGSGTRKAMARGAKLRLRTRGMQKLSFVLLLGACIAPAQAQDAAQAPPEADTKQLERLIETLEDEGKRRTLVEDLKALIAARQKAEARAEQPVGAQLLETLSDRVGQAGRRLGDAAATLVDFPKLVDWIGKSLSDPETRSTWLSVILKLAVILTAGLAAEWLALRGLRRPRAAIETKSADGFWLHLTFAATRTMLELVAVAFFAAGAYGAMALTAPPHEGQVIALALINASLIARAVMSIARMILAPRVSSMRLIAADDETANYAFVWIRRLTNVTAYGFFILGVALALGLADAAHTVLVKLLGLTIGLFLIMLALQNRQAVAGLIRGDENGSLRGFRDRLADIWHILMILYLVVVYGVWAIDLAGGFDFVARATVLTAAILIVSQAAIHLLSRLVRRGFSLSDEQKRRFPGLEGRANRYLPMLLIAIKAAVYGAAALALLDVWGLEVLAWLAGPVGAAVLPRVATIALIVVLALVVWEVTSVSIERYLTATDREGNALTRSQRAQTLLPLLRNVVLIVLSVLVVLTVLSELGVNIGPLIAGAGIVGLAVGFGAQTIVKDFITGFFILIEDSVAVGDIVRLGSHSGVVEAMSIRSIQLRNLSGQVHRIPFSEVSTTINMSKGFSYAVFDVGVGYSEDVDRVLDVVRRLGEELQADPEYTSAILDPIQIMGVQELGDSAVVVRSRIRVQPGKQFGIQRAFYRMVKKRFDKEGIEIPFPHRTLYFGEDSRSEAPPAHIRMETREGAKSEPAGPAKPMSRRPEGERRNAGAAPSDTEIDPAADSE